MKLALELVPDLVGGRQIGRHQLGDRHTKRFGQLHQCIDEHTLLAALDIRDGRPSQAWLKPSPQLLLRKPTSPKCPDSPAKGCVEGLRAGHAELDDSGAPAPVSSNTSVSITDASSDERLIIDKAHPLRHAGHCPELGRSGRVPRDAVVSARFWGSKAMLSRRLEKPQPWSVDAEGVLDSRHLPDPDFDAQWDAIIAEPALKDELLALGVLNFTLRPHVQRALVPLHGLLLLVGPPGTGKTSLARGLASRVAGAVEGLGTFRYIEVEPHVLASAALGRSQKAVTELFGQTIAERADVPLIVLLDEVETLAADRTKMSLAANPIDVHRATDAVLAQLDHLAANHPNLLFIATSNFAEAVDEAFISRADAVRTIGLPTPEACRAILQSTIHGLGVRFPALRALENDRNVDRAAKACHGLDGRQIRKVVISACARRKEVALDPALLKGTDVLAAAEAARAERTNAKEKAR